MIPPPVKCKGCGEWIFPQARTGPGIEVHWIVETFGDGLCICCWDDLLTPEPAHFDSQGLYSYALPPAPAPEPRRRSSQSTPLGASALNTPGKVWMFGGGRRRAGIRPL